MGATKLEQYITTANSPAYRKQFEAFKKFIFVHTLLWEGGSKLHKVSGDSGGWTLYGIAYNYNKDLFTDLADFKDTVYDEAAAVAFCRYYMTAQVNRVPYSAQLMYFDMCYNLGTTTAIKLMQRCAGVHDDGNIGPMTRAAMQHVTEQCLYQQRMSYYGRLAAAKANLRKFLKGWQNRTNDILVRNDREVAA